MDRTEITARYLEALGLERRRPEADFLDEIARRHVARFPFASVGPQLGDALPRIYEVAGPRLALHCFVTHVEAKAPPVNGKSGPASVG